MNPAHFSRFLDIAAAAFCLGLPLIQGLVLGELRRRGRDPELVGAGSMRDHVLGSVLRALRLGAVWLVVSWGIWILVRRPPLGWSWGLGAEVLAALLVLQLGLSLFTVRLALQHAGSERPRLKTVTLIRVGVLLVGWAYGAAVWTVQPGGPGETLFSVLILGIGLSILGLNRILRVPREVLVRLGEL